MGSQQFCLRWNNHQTNMLNVFDQLLQSEDFVDVTLACEGLSMKAHKVVLSACSPYFQSLFKENPCKHPIVILKDMKYTELRSIVDFMYKGEINVSQDQLSNLLKTAETLKVKGLAEVSSGAVPPSSHPHSNHGSGENGGSGGSGNGGGGGDDMDVSGGGGGTATSIADDIATQLQQQRQNATSPLSNEDGRMSPHSRRKRHRPMRRPSNDDSMNQAIEPSEVCFEPIGDTDPKITPKTEPVELLSEPPIELLMDANPNYDLDMQSESHTRYLKGLDDVTFPTDDLYEKMIHCLELKRGEYDPRISDFVKSKISNVRSRCRLEISRGQKRVVDVKTGKPIAKQSEMPAILKQFHDDCGHPGASVVRSNIKDVYAFCNVLAVRNYVKSCKFCQSRKDSMSKFGHI